MTWAQPPRWSQQGITDVSVPKRRQNQTRASPEPSRADSSPCEDLTAMLSTLLCPPGPPGWPCLPGPISSIAEAPPLWVWSKDSPDPRPLTLSLRAHGDGHKSQDTHSRVAALKAFQKQDKRPTRETPDPRCSECSESRRRAGPARVVAAGRGPAAGRGSVGSSTSAQEEAGASSSSCGARSSMVWPVRLLPLAILLGPGKRWPRPRETQVRSPGCLSVSLPGDPRGLVAMPDTLPS